MKILIIDDEPLVAKTLARLLRGHETQVVGNARDAVDLVCGGEFEIVFCDLMMPHLSGQELYDAVCERNDSLGDRFVFITGGTFTAKADAFLATPGRRVLYKPFGRDNLQTIVSQMSK